MTFPVVWLIACIVAAVASCLYFRVSGGNYAELANIATVIVCCGVCVVGYFAGVGIWWFTK